MKWHSTLRETLISRTLKELTLIQNGEGFGVPIPFAVDPKTTNEAPVAKEERSRHRVWVRQPGSGLDKCQCTLQIAFGPKNSIKTAIIFRGSGKRICKDEIAAYHQGVDVFWQSRTWAGTAFSINWVKRTFAPAVGKLEEFVLFCDNLAVQVTAQFQSAVKSLGVIVWYVPAGATDI